MGHKHQHLQGLARYQQFKHIHTPLTEDKPHKYHTHHKYLNKHILFMINKLFWFTHIFLFSMFYVWLIISFSLFYGTIHTDHTPTHFKRKTQS